MTIVEIILKETRKRPDLPFSTRWLMEGFRSRGWRRKVDKVKLKSALTKLVNQGLVELIWHGKMVSVYKLTKKGAK
jgi:DNA-binding PadR family transcriptional regulator